MKRRAFLATLGGALTAVAAKPVVALVPTEPARLTIVPAVDDTAWIDMANAIAFAIHSEWSPVHRPHYRARALAALARYRDRR